MYHYISTPPEDADAIRLDLSVPPERFEEHLRYLRNEGYTSITLEELTLALHTDYPLPAKPVVLTFDDGYRDSYTNAFPLLCKYGFEGTFFLITAYIDEQRPEYVTWDQVIEMAAAGMEMQAHGHTHVDLRDRTADYLIWQMLGSRQAIEARTHKPVRFFCYPFGKYDDLAIEALHLAQYWGAVTINPGAIHDSYRMFELARVRVHGTYKAEGLVAAIETFTILPWDNQVCTTIP